MQVASEFATLPDLLRVRTRADPDAPFVQHAGRGFTYGEFDARTDDLAAGFAQLGVRPGDVVSVFLGNRLEFLEAWWGIVKAGGVLGPVNPAYVGPEAAYVIGHSDAVALVTDARGAALLGAHRGELARVRSVISVDEGGDLRLGDLAVRGASAPDPGRGPSDLASIPYTSGTTGRPNGAMLTHRNLLVNATQGAELVPLTPGERVGMLLPLFHANAQVVTTLIPMMIGCHVMMWEGFSASTFWDTVAELEPVTISAVPTILAAVTNADNAPGRENSLRYVICGAAPLSVELLQAFQDRFGIRILEGFGMTETACIASMNPFYGERRPGSIGLPIRGQSMRVVDDAGAPVPPGAYGEIVVRGPNVMAGYLKNPEATADAIRDGWLHTGDIGHVDEDGYFYIVDRSKDMIIRGGENIYPREIEEVIYEHEAVLECAVIGIPDPVRGEEVLAVVVAKDGATLDTDELAAFAAERLTAFAAERLAKYKLPRRYALHDELPKTPTGKISKGPLRDRYGHWTRPAPARRKEA
jgi:acyl-CoA synthetase (AMP-forming)/AMP-acid ligase II